MKNFNSHTREGVTKKYNCKIGNIVNFNSHTREGVTSLLESYKNLLEISTHTPVRV